MSSNSIFPLPVSFCCISITKTITMSTVMVYIKDMAVMLRLANHLNKVWVAAKIIIPIIPIIIKWIGNPFLDKITPNKKLL